MRLPLRAGIVGYGYMGTIRHRTVNDNPEIDVVAICDPFRRETLTNTGVTVFEDWKDLLTSDIDVVFVCTPNVLIPEIAVTALHRGLHVFCEKPPGRSLGDVERIREAEAANPGQKLIFGFNHRHHPGILDARAIIDSGALGDVHTLRGMYGKDGGYDYASAWRNDPEVGGGGILLDQGIHMLDLFRFFLGDFDAISGMRSILEFDVPAEDNAAVLLRTPKGQLAMLHSSATSWNHTFRLEIGCSRGYANISGLLSKTGSYGRETLVIGRRPAPGENVAKGNPREETTYYDADLSWATEVAHLVDSIRGDVPVEKGTSLDALRVMQIIDTVYREPPVRMRG